MNRSKVPASTRQQCNPLPFPADDRLAQRTVPEHKDFARGIKGLSLTTRLSSDGDVPPLFNGSSTHIDALEACAAKWQVSRERERTRRREQYHATIAALAKARHVDFDVMEQWLDRRINEPFDLSDHVKQMIEVDSEINDELFVYHEPGIGALLPIRRIPSPI